MLVSFTLKSLYIEEIGYIVPTHSPYYFPFVYRLFAYWNAKD